jgi:hypothetical protein
MNISTFAFLSLVTSSSAFSCVSNSAYKAGISTTQLNAESEGNVSRRNMMFATGSSTLAFLLSNSQAANAEASLLDQFGSDPKKIVQKADEKVIVPAGKKKESEYEPNLRSNYYYPTNKKRYLPRIKKCNDAIPVAAEAIGSEDWVSADEFVNKIADDTILPLKLYTSSLAGGGTNVKVTFTKDMFAAADGFEKAQKSLAKAIKKKDQTASSKALEDLSTNLQAYREAGKLTGPDAGGDIPSVDEIRRSACRVQGRSFEQKVRDRDARLEAAKVAAAPKVAAAQ